MHSAASASRPSPRPQAGMPSPPAPGPARAGPLSVHAGGPPPRGRSALDGEALEVLHKRLEAHVVGLDHLPAAAAAAAARVRGGGVHFGQQETGLGVTRRISLDDIDKKAFEEVLDLWCGKDDSIEKELREVIAVASLADRLQMGDVVAALENSILVELETGACAEVLISSQRYGSLHGFRQKPKTMKTSR